MDRFSDSNFEKQTIYQIYRACRLCGAGAGYKMPIIQNVVDLDGRDVELRQKIRDCVQIEVSQEDKMPPLICELCVDKVNDFYEFLEMCRQTNKRTRQRLGLPPQTLARGASDTGDCILGITEPVYVNDETDEPVSKNKSKVQRGKVKKEPAVKIKAEPEILDDRRSRRSSSTGKRRTRNSLPSPPPLSRDTRRQSDTQQHGKKTTAPLKSILKKEKDIKMENNLPRLKRLREKETHQELPTKRVKIAAKPVTKSPKPTPKATPKPAKPTLKPPTTSRKRSPMHACEVCGAEFASAQSLAGHRRVHSKRAINASRASRAAKQQKNNHCPTKESRSPPNAQRSLKCDKCERVYLSQKNFQRHQSSCTIKEKVSQAVVDPFVLRTLRRVQIRVARCDSLLASKNTCRVTDVDKDYGLDTNCVYPYISSVRSLRIKCEPEDSYNAMVDIGEEIKRELEEGAFVHWDSDNSSDSDQEVGSDSKRRPAPLSRLALKTIYSDRFLGKVPRKRRRVKLEDSTIDSVERFDYDNNLERISEEISNKVASFDDVLQSDIENEREKTEENSREDNVNKSAKDCVIGDSQTVGDNLDKDGTYDVSTKSSDNLQSGLNSEDSKVKEANIEDNELADSNISKSRESNILNDDIRDTIVNNEDEVATKSISVSGEDVKETDKNKREVVSEESTNTKEETSQESDNKETVNEHDGSKEEVNGEIINAEEKEDNDAQNTQKSEEITHEETEVDTEIARNTNETDCNIVTDDKENGATDKDEESNAENSKCQNEEEIENELAQEEECDVNKDDITEKCITNGIADPKDLENSKENKEDISDSTDKQEVSDVEQVTGNTQDKEENILYNAEESRASLNGGEFSDEMDRKLMEELDAQIGECEGEGDSACDRDKITLADLLPDKSHEKLDLDSMADEFNFDP